ncbi:MAG: trigger factor [Patescibacteria group bacterium]
MSDITRLDNGNIEIPITLPWVDVQREFDHQIDDAVAKAKIEGFRPGKAPRELVAGKLDQNDLVTHAIQHLLPEVYAKAIKEAGIKPLVYPHLRLVSGKQDEDWQFIAVTCETPVVNLPEDLKLTQLPADLSRENKLDRVITELRKYAPQIPDVLVEEESNHRLGALAENITKLGMNMDQYLSSKKLTLEDFKAKAATEAKSDLEVEFILQKAQDLYKKKDRKETLDHLLSMV